MTRAVRLRRAIARLVAFSVAFGGAMYPSAASASTFDVSGLPLQFTNFPTPSDDLGVLATAGYSVRYEDVVTVDSTTVDAIVTVLSVNGLDSDDDNDNGENNKLDKLDDGSSSRSTVGIDTEIDVFGSSCTITDDPPCTGNVVIRVAFVEDGTSNAVTLENVTVSVKDVDSRQFVEFSTVKQYRLSNVPSTRLTVSEPATGRTRFTASSASSNDDDQRNWVEVSFERLSFVDYVLGANESGSASFGVFFSPVSFSNASTTVLEAPNYTITYDGNGASRWVPSPTTGRGTQTIASAMSRHGFTFTGWNTAADGSGVEVSPESSYSPASDLTLYAQWLRNPSTATFNSNGGSGSMTPQMASSATALTANSFTRAGYTFAGWNTAADGSGTSYADSASYPFTLSVTLYAQWLEAPTVTAPTVTALTVSTDEQGGSAVANATTTTGASMASPGTPSRAGYSFTGWYTAASGGSAISFPWTHGRTANFTLYAQWRQLPTFNALTGAATVNTSFGLVASSGDYVLTLVSDTPNVCRTVRLNVVFVAPGACSVRALSDNVVMHSFDAQVQAPSAATRGRGGKADPSSPLRLLNRAFVYFGPDSAAITPAARAELRRLAAVLRSAGAVTVTGHAADAGDPSDRVAVGLSRRRAQAVSDFFDARGIAVTIEGASGKALPASASDRALNRRVEIAWYTTQP